MRRLLLLLVVVAVATLIGTNFGWVWIGAPLLGYTVYTFVISNLRGLAHGARMGAPDDDEVLGTPMRPDERVLFWCEECGTEVLLLVRGTTRAPSHCGQRMHERIELLAD